MARIVWSLRARHHLKDIVDYLSAESPNRGQRVHASVLRAAERIGRWPESGPWVGAVYPQLSRLPETFRLAVSRPYLIFYALQGDDVQILDIQHGAQRLPTRETLERARQTTGGVSGMDMG